MSNESRSTRNKGALASCLILSATLCACSSAVAPKESIGAAKMAIEEAERLDAGSYAQADLDRARSKLNTAEMKSNKDEHILARRYAEQAAVDANLARARAQLGKSTRVLQESAGALSDVQNEIQRNQ